MKDLITRQLQEFDEMIKGSKEKDFEDGLRFCSCMEGDLYGVFDEEIKKVKQWHIKSIQEVIERLVESLIRYDVYDGGEADDEDGDYVKFSDIKQQLLDIK